ANTWRPRPSLSPVARADQFELAADSYKWCFDLCTLNFALLFDDISQTQIPLNLKVQRSKYKAQNRAGKDYRSISPKTISSDPIIATMSATIAPRAISGSAERFTKLGPRKCTRAGFGPPVDLM